MSLTDRQRDYIEYMLTNAYTDEKDENALKDVLKIFRPGEVHPEQDILLRFA